MNKRLIRNALNPFSGKPLSYRWEVLRYYTKTRFWRHWYSLQPKRREQYYPGW